MYNKTSTQCCRRNSKPERLRNILPESMSEKINSNLGKNKMESSNLAGESRNLPLLVPEI